MIMWSEKDQDIINARAFIDRLKTVIGETCKHCYGALDYQILIDEEGIVIAVSIQHKCTFRRFDIDMTLKR